MNAYTPTTKTKLYCALEWAARGFKVFPLAPGSKIPIEGLAWKEAATTDPETIRALWTNPQTGESANYNVAYVPDRAHCVVDLDVKDGRQGIANYRALGGLVAGLVIRTPSGGIHVYLKGHNVACGDGKVAEGIDVKAANAGYVVAPGSTIDDKAYEVIEDGAMLTVPQFVVDAVGSYSDRPEKAGFVHRDPDDSAANLARAIEAAERHEPAVTGRWHSLGFTLGAELARIGVSFDAAYQTVHDHWARRGTGLTDLNRLRADLLGGYERAIADGEFGLNAAGDPAEGFAGVVPAPPDGPSAESKPEAPAVEAPSGPAWTIMRPSDLAGVAIPEREYIVKDWLSPGHVTLLYAEGGTGKSLLALQLMTAAATGKPWCGLQVKQCRAFGLFCEDDPAELHRRQANINAAYGLDWADLKDMAWVSGVGCDNTLVSFDRDGQATATPAFLRFGREAKQFGARLLFLDTAADIFGGEENVRRQVRLFLGQS